MTTGETVNLWGSVVALAGCLAFVLGYTLFARWWRDPVGRLLVTKATAIAVFMSISIGVTAGIGDAEIQRTARGILAGLFGAMMLYQTRLMIRLQMRGARRDHTDT